MLCVQALVIYLRVGVAMKSRISSRLAVATLALLAVTTLSSCNKKTDQSVNTDTQTAPDTTSSPASPAGTTSSPGSSTSAGAGVSAQGTTCPAGNPIKGITSKRLGGKIYVTDKSPDYGKTKPEKCFPDTASAEKAGYKAPK